MIMQVSSILDFCVVFFVCLFFFPPNFSNYTNNGIFSTYTANLIPATAIKSDCFIYVAVFTYFIYHNCG